MKPLFDILKVFNSNVVMLVSNMIISFFLPLILSVSDYGQYREYILYIAYIAIFNLGYIDGIYIKYGGKDLQENKTFLKREHRYLIIFQLIVTVVSIPISLLLKDAIYLFLSLSILPINVGGFHKILYQSTGLFSKYSRANIFFTILNVLFIVGLLAFKIKNPYYYIGATLAAYFFLFFIMEIDFYKLVAGVSSDQKIYYANYFKIGLFILMGNFSILFFNNMGAWIVNFFFPLKDFAQYSFANSLLNMVLMAVSAVGLTFYNYLAKKEDIKLIKFTQNILIMLGIVSGAFFFFLKLIIISFLPRYMESLDIIAVSFVNLPYIMVINVIIINLYKARKQERKFFAVVFVMLLVSFVLNVGSYLLSHSLTIIALATTISYILWYFICTNLDFPFLKNKLLEVILFGYHFFAFLFCSHFLNWYVGFVLYFTTVTLLVVRCYKDEVVNLLKQVKKIRGMT